MPKVALNDTQDFPYQCLEEPCSTPWEVLLKAYYYSPIQHMREPESLARHLEEP